MAIIGKCLHAGGWRGAHKRIENTTKLLNVISLFLLLLLLKGGFGCWALLSFNLVYNKTEIESIFGTMQHTHTSATNIEKTVLMEIRQLNILFFFIRKASKSANCKTPTIFMS